MSKFIPDVTEFNDFSEDVFKHQHRKSGIGKTLLAFFLGGILGVAGFFGGLYFAGQVILSQPIGSTVEQLDGSIDDDLYSLVFGTDAEHSGFINASYAEKTFADLFGDLGKAAEDIVHGKGTINTLNGILPIVSDKVVSITDGLTESIGIPVDNTTLMDTPLSGLGDFFLNTLQTAKAGDILTKFAGGEMNSLMMYFCYGEENVDYVINEETGKPEMLEGHEDKAVTIQGLFGSDFVAQLETIPLANIIDEGNDTTDSIMLNLLYGSENRYTKNDDGTFKDMKQVEYTVTDNKFFDDKDIEVADVPTPTAGVYEITVDEKQQYVKLVGEKYLVYTDATCETPLTYAKTTLTSIKDVSTIIDDIYLKDVIDVEGNSILESLAYDENGEPRKIKDLGGSEGDKVINTILLSDVITIGTDSPRILKSIVYEDPNASPLKSRTLGDLRENSADIINDLKLEDVMNVGNDSPKILTAIVYENGDKTKPRTLKDLSENSSGIINDLKLEDVLEVDEDSPKILQSLVKDENGNSRTLKDLTEHSDEIINDIKLSDVLAEDKNNEIIMFMLHGKKGLAYSASGDTITYNKRRVAILGTTLYDEYGVALTDATLNGTSSYTIKGVTYTLERDGDATQKIENVNAPLYFVKDENGYVYYGPTTLGDMSGSSNPVKNITKSLTLKEIVGESNIGDNKILSLVSNETIDTLPSAIDKLYINDIFSDSIYESDGTTLKGTWKYLLLTDFNNPASEGKYTINQMDTLITNMTNNMQKATLNDLNDDGIMSLDSGALNQEIKSEIKVGSGSYAQSYPVNVPTELQGKATIGDLTASQVVVYMNALLNAINALTS